MHSYDFYTKQQPKKNKNAQKTLLLLIFNTNCFPYFFNYAAFPYKDIT